MTRENLNSTANTMLMRHVICHRLFIRDVTEDGSKVDNIRVDKMIMPVDKSITPISHTKQVVL